MTTAIEIWKTLSRVDVSQHIQKKGGLSYLPWASAWTVLMEHYPGASFEFKPDRDLPDGTVEVLCTVSIGDTTREMFLPVMDHRNKAIVSPNARDRSDARVRCLVKCLSLFGLGLHLYRGEDVNPVAAQPRISDNQVAQIEAAIAATETELAKVLSAYGIPNLADMTEAQFARASKQLQAKARKMAQ